LPEHIRRKLTVRFFLGLSNEYYWQNRYPDIRLEAGVTSILKLIAQSRLVVHSYDSTGILETLTLNIPTICFWYGGLKHILNSAKPYYEFLRNAGILLDSPESVSEFIASNWDSVDEWWGSKEVQDARKEFCGQYARIEKHPIRALRKLLTQNVKQTRQIVDQNILVGKGDNS
jgi:putative transferase (TIGR04331 family)